jgi:lambda family phage portal protein
MKKPNLFLRFLSVIAPNHAINVLRARYAQRAYSGAEDYPSSDWNTVSYNSSANDEIARDQKTLIARSRDLARNNPYAKKASDVIVSNVVGYGIVPKITGRNKSETKLLQDKWREIAETPLCDNENRHNFYSQQMIAMRTIVESGEVLAIKYIDPEAPRIQLLEPDFIDTSTKTSKSGSKYINGILVDDRNRRLAYRIFENHPGESILGTESKDISADKIIHVFDQKRPGQLRGVPWSHSVINTLQDFADFQYATIVRQKISACLVGVITSLSDNLLPPDKRNEKRLIETKMTPGSFKYAEPGEDVKFNTPPTPQGYGEFISETIRAIACGYGITYESISNDYSLVNFSSGRMGHLEMRNNFEMWRWNMLIPLFCDPYMKMFLEWCKLHGFIKDTNSVKFEWVAPAYKYIDPIKEIAADKEAVKAGFKSRSMVIREQGLDPDLVREEIKTERDADEALGLKFDVYMINEGKGKQLEDESDDIDSDKNNEKSS